MLGNLVAQTTDSPTPNWPIWVVADRLPTLNHA
jgi:hypothetical protein